MSNLHNSSNRRIPELDGLRGLAILMVVYVHYIPYNFGSVSAGSLFAYGLKVTSNFWWGVDLFFVLSGFLIGGIFLDNKLNRKFCKTYFIRRIGRIGPAIILTYILYLILGQFSAHESLTWLFKNDVIPFWSYLSFTQNFVMASREVFGAKFLSVTWSLAVEEQFYLLLPFLFLIRRKKIMLFLVVCFVLLAFTLRVYFSQVHSLLLMPMRMDSLFLGLLVAAIYRSNKMFLRLKAIGLILAVLCFLAVGLLLLDSVSPILGSIRISIISLTFTLLLLLVLVYKGSNVTLLLRSPVLAFFGKISYGLYLYHQIIIGLLFGFVYQADPQILSVATFCLTLAAFFISTVVSLISFRYLEEPIRKLCYRFSYS